MSLATTRNQTNTGTDDEHDEHDNNNTVSQRQQPIEEDNELFIEAYAVQVEPQQCYSLIRQLQNQQHELQHLKRVKTVSAALSNNDDSASLKRQKVSEQRLVLLGTIRSERDTIERYSKQYTLQRVLIPKRPPNSLEEWNQMNEKWPTKRDNYLAIEQELEARRISSEEIKLMEDTIQQVLIEKDTVLLDPSSGSIVGRASAERRLQLGTTNNNKSSNPLQTDILYAIQNVSRRERTQSTCSYLCTGLDLYTIHEPSLLEGMAALHSRVRRIIFVNSATSLGALTHYSLHTLSSTNHHFRAFQWNELGLASDDTS